MIEANCGATAEDLSCAPTQSLHPCGLTQSADRGSPRSAICVLPTSGVHQDLDGGVIVADYGVEAILNEALHLDLGGDERGECDLDILDEFDDGGVIVGVGNRAAEVDFLQDKR